jgi:hypothetical protein
MLQDINYEKTAAALTVHQLLEEPKCGVALHYRISFVYDY